MKKIFSILFAGLCLALCAAPFLGMSVAPTMTTTENTEMVRMPSLKEDGAWNIDILSDLGAYFENHFAGRNWLVTADSMILGKAFSTSAVDKVVYGKKNWLYYESTVNDYLGENTISDREAYNLARNLSIMQKYVEERGGHFLFCVPPNKNSLYGENMPDHNKKKVSPIRNMDKLTPLLEEKKLNYSDLFSLFRDQEEVLYLKRDSHWNNKGAFLVYDQILTDIHKDHDSYEVVPALRTKEYVGDLNRMLYPKLAEKEFNLEYQKETEWTYREGKDVEEEWLATENKKGEGTLLMYRDSFGNTLLPFMADSYKKAYFANERPYFLESEMDQYKPDTVIVEKVERNVTEYLTSPPLLCPVPVKADIQATEENDQAATVSMAANENDPAYWTIRGKISPDYIKAGTDILVTVEDGQELMTCDAYGIGENAYAIYRKKEDIRMDQVRVTVSVRDGKEIRPLTTKTIDVNALKIEEVE